MGLLTDAKQRQWLVRIVLRYHQKLSVLLYVGGLLWFFALAYRPLNAGTYFSENALLPGLVESNLPQGFSSLFNYVNALKEEMKKDKQQVPKDWIFRQFQDLGLDTYRQNFTINYPFKMAIKDPILGENIFAILRARRAASTEALVMMSPLRSQSSKRVRTHGGIALMLGLAEQFRRNPYWSKDVIFLLTEFEEIGTLAWLNAYHETQSPYIVGDDLAGRSGPIQAAINLEFPGDKVRNLNLKVEGLNGQLPNLDLVNLAVRLGRREQVHVTLHNRGDHHDQETWEGFQRSLGTMLHMMWTQASGAPSGCHGVFHRYHIEALTLEGVSTSKGVRSYPLDQLARVVEGIFRSLNNLMERFHQSFFFYLLPSTDRYVSIGLYMPPFGLMALSGVIKALTLWIMVTSPPESEEAEEVQKTQEKASRLAEKQAEGEKKEESKDAGEEHDSHAKKKGTGAQEVTAEGDDSDDEEGVEIGISMKNFLSVMPVILMSLMLGLLAYSTPYLMTKLEPSRVLNANDILTYGNLAVFSAALTYPYLLNRKASPEDRVGFNWQLLKCLGLLAQALTLFAVSLINISLAFFIAATSLPVMMVICAVKNRFLRVLQMGALLIVSPMGLLWMVAFVQAAQAEPKASVLLIVWHSIEEMMQLLFLMLVDQYVLYSWTYLVVSMAFFPTWLLFWAIPFCDIP